MYIIANATYANGKFMHIAFIDTNTDRSAFGLSHPKEWEKFRTLLAPIAPDWRYDDFYAPDGAFPDLSRGYDGIMISGSVASVNDPAPWVAQLMDAIRAAVEAGVPVFGACFGHQAIAKALGGAVTKNPQGWVLGRFETHNHTPAPWMNTAPGPMALHAAHKEQVSAPPPGAQILAGTDTVPNGHMALGRKVFSTQYHPELDHAFMMALFDEMEGEADTAVLNAARAGMEGPVDSAQMARWIVAFFEQAKA